MVEHDGEPHMIYLCKNCNSLRPDEKKEPSVNGKQRENPVAEKRSRGKLSAGLGARGLENKTW